MARPTRPPHNGRINNPKTFHQALEHLQNVNLQEFATLAGTPFSANVRVATKGMHQGETCIQISSDGVIRAYIYECCWGHETNCTRTYIDRYSARL